MNLMEIVNRTPSLRPWVDGEKIPWNEPEFSRRMLQNHLDQAHDWASRRRDLIERQLTWINGRLAPGSRILDLACGPGFYTQRLAEIGHHCRGVDFSPASIDYAREQARTRNLAIDYVLEDIRKYRCDDLFDCLIFVFGEFNVFSEADARGLLAGCRQMLLPGGLLILEGHYLEAVRDTGLAPASWWSCGPDEGVLSARPHICLQENFWDEGLSTATTRYFIVDGETGRAAMYGSSMTGYSQERYEDLFQAAGFGRPRILSSEEWPVGGPFEGVMLTFVCEG